MRTVWKYPVRIDDEFEIEMPVGARVLAVAMQGDAPQMWVLVEQTQTRTERRRFRLAGTGHPISDHWHRYISSFQMYDGALVWHLFEQAQTATDPA